MDLWREVVRGTATGAVDRAGLPVWRTHSSSSSSSPPPVSNNNASGGAPHLGGGSSSTKTTTRRRTTMMMSDAEIVGLEGSKESSVFMHFSLLGRLCAKALQDRRSVDLRLHPLLLRLAQPDPRDIVPRESDIAQVR
eukprot:GHVU01164743.1.p1 GENE.GHVU01164743.1~~GHVU01164743.1.p1  ORF type:complete len:137 (-),score=30.86 GHVU01164743.1:92-502(-)